MKKKDIKDYTLKELEKAFSAMGEPSYRARQVFSWLYEKGASGFSGMANIPETLRKSLGEKYYIGCPEPGKRQRSGDGAEKILFKLTDGQCVETVIIPAGRRNTLCLSTQVGCKFACVFCRSGSKGFIRNLTSSEITGQILYFTHGLKQKISNYVFMGMGEPLDNFENLEKAILIMNHPKGMGIGARRITVSTCGIIPGIEKLKDLGQQINLSVSLHAATDKARDKLMPINKKYPLEELIKACASFLEKTGRILTLEYTLIKGINDSLEDVTRLAGIASRLGAKINLIPYSAIPGLGFQAVGPKETRAFMTRLAGKGVKVTLRESKGKDIMAACGQLGG